MVKITFLGTSGSTPTKSRSMPSVAIEYEGKLLLFDCGEAAQRQAMIYDINISKLEAVFITHTHGDHIIGIAGLIRTLALNKRSRPLLIFVPRGGEDAIRKLLDFDKAIIGYETRVVGIRAGKVYSDGNYTVSAFRLNHNIPTYGYAFELGARLRFKKDKCAELGIKGPMFRDLASRKSINIGGRRIGLNDVTYKVKGIKVVYATDTRPSKTTVVVAKGADLLIHEASYGSELATMAKERYHSTAKEAATIAKAAGCRRLALFHISARYKDPSVLVTEAKKVFKNSELPNDGETIVL